MSFLVFHKIINIITIHIKYMIKKIRENNRNNKNKR